MREASLIPGLDRGPIVDQASVSFTRVSSAPAASTYDPLTDAFTPTPGAILTASSTGRAVQPSPAEAARYEAMGWSVTKTVVLEVDPWGLESFVPAQDDKVTWGAIDYAVRDVGKVAPDGRVRLYRIVATC